MGATSEIAWCLGSAVPRSGIPTLLERNIEVSLGFADVLIEGVVDAIRSLPQSVITTKSLRHKIDGVVSGETRCRSRRRIVEE